MRPKGRREEGKEGETVGREEVSVRPGRGRE